MPLFHSTMQLIEWPEVTTEGSDLEDCRASLKDAVKQMVLAYNKQNKEIPIENALIESFPVLQYSNDRDNE